jgi:hypothetical protein
MARWLLDRANNYQPQHPVSSWTEFPMRTPGLVWPADREKFVSLVVRKKQVQLERCLSDSSFTLVAEKKFK